MVIEREQERQCGSSTAVGALLFSVCTLHNIYAFEQRQEAP